MASFAEGLMQGILARRKSQEESKEKQSERMLELLKLQMTSREIQSKLEEAAREKERELKNRLAVEQFKSKVDAVRQEQLEGIKSRLQEQKGIAQEERQADKLQKDLERQTFLRTMGQKALSPEQISEVEAVFPEAKITKPSTLGRLSFGLLGPKKASVTFPKGSLSRLGVSPKKFTSPDDVKNAIKEGNLTKKEGIKILQREFGYK